MTQHPRHRSLYWSLTGHSARLARAIAGALDSAAEAVEIPAYSGFVGKLRMGLDFPAKRSPKLAPVPVGLAAAETVTLCGPVWGGYPAPAVRSLLRLPDLPQTVGIALTCGSTGQAREAVRRCEAVLGRPFQSTMLLENAQEDTAAEGERVAAYAAELAS